MTVRRGNYPRRDDIYIRVMLQLYCDPAGAVLVGGLGPARARFTHARPRSRFTRFTKLGR